ncbi:MAG TPA: SDR family oxidoreductase [Candidatus Acidoferrales bacterium]|nr:SDR family oxidoreductase [Candidatus Acidoferrales bacterium]
MSPSNSTESSPAEPAREQNPSAPGREPLFWRVEGSLLNLTAVPTVGFFTWNAQSFLGRWARRGAMGVLAVARPFLYAADRVFATRVLHAVLRHQSCDRLDLLGEEFFHYHLKPRLKPRGVQKLREAMASGADVVLVSQALDHIMRPLASYLGVGRILSNRLDFRDGIATGRLLDPVIRPRGPFAKLGGDRPDGTVPTAQLLRDLGFAKKPETLQATIRPAQRPSAKVDLPVVHFDSDHHGMPVSVRGALHGKQILLIGGTGFIGKVWLANLLSELPEIGRIHLLVRSHRSLTALERFERVVEESPVFDKLAELHGARFADFLRERVEVLSGDASKPGLGLEAETRLRLARSLDLVVNSAGLTDFNPDLRDALAMNVHSTIHLLDFLRECDRAALLHLSTCYAVGRRDGRILEELPKNYTPRGVADFDAATECKSLETLIREVEAKAESEELAGELRRQALGKRQAAKNLRGAVLENQIRKNRVRWLRQAMMDAGTQRAQELGWPNTYTFTKSLSESLIRSYLDESPGAAIAVVRPSIVESSIERPFLGWNEGVNTSASLSYLLGTFFRQLPTNESKCLDLIPVDLVCRGMVLISAALIDRRHERIYHLATSVANPCDMRRSIELTGLGHRKFYRSQNGFQHRLRSRFDAIPVSKARYEKLSAPAQKILVQAINRSVEPFPFVRPPLARQERELEKVIKLIALFEPFILENDHVFEAANIERLSAALPPQERDAFRYDSRSLDWWDYWINVHIPALRKWCYPLIEGRPPETRPRRSVPLAARTEASAAGAAGSSPATTS